MHQPLCAEFLFWEEVLSLLILATCPLNVWPKKCHKVVKNYICIDQPEASLMSHLFSLKPKANQFPSEALSNQRLSIIYIIIRLFSSVATLPRVSCWRIHKAAPQNMTFSTFIYIFVPEMLRHEGNNRTSTLGASRPTFEQRYKNATVSAFKMSESVVRTDQRQPMHRGMKKVQSARV